MEQVGINPRYLGYNTAEVRQLLKKVEDITIADETDVRTLVTDYISEEHKEEEEPSEGS